MSLRPEQVIMQPLMNVDGVGIVDVGEEPGVLPHQSVVSHAEVKELQYG